MRILTILLILVLAVGAGYAQTPENMKLRVKVIDAEGARFLDSWAGRQYSIITCRISGCGSAITATGRSGAGLEAIPL